MVEGDGTGKWSEQYWVPSVLGRFRGAGEEGVVGPDLCPTSTDLTVVWGLGGGENCLRNTGKKSSGLRELWLVLASGLEMQDCRGLSEARTGTGAVSLGWGNGAESRASEASLHQWEQKRV